MIDWAGLFIRLKYRWRRFLHPGSHVTGRHYDIHGVDVNLIPHDFRGGR